jgi:hypothetical protein
MSEKSVAAVKTEAKPSLNIDRSGLLQRKCDCGNAAGLTGECSGCQGKKLTVQRREKEGSAAEVPAIVHDVLRSSGQPLDPTTRTFMESRFNQGLTYSVQPLDPSIAKSDLAVGAVGNQYEREADRVAGQVMRLPSSEMPVSSRELDFSQVRIHSDYKANQSAAALKAQAYTYRDQIVFGSGRYMPNTVEGRELLAHELTHVLQQRSQSATALQTKLIGSPSELLPTQDALSSQAVSSLQLENLPAQASEFELPVSPSATTVSEVRPDVITQAKLPASPFQVATNWISPSSEGITIPAAITPTETAPTPEITSTEIQPVTSTTEALQSLSGVPYSSFGAAVFVVRAASPQIQTQEKSDLAARFPSIDRPTGLPVQTERFQPASTNLNLIAAPDLPSATVRMGEPPSTEVEQPDGSLPGASVSTAAAEPNGEESEGNWWDWLTDRVSNFAANLPTTDSDVDTSAGDRPQVDLTGDADPNRNANYQQLTNAAVITQQGQADATTQVNFGENQIYPTVPAERLTSSYQPTTPAGDLGAMSGAQVSVPEEHRAAIDQGTAPWLSGVVNEKLGGYQQQQLNYQQQVDTIQQQGQMDVVQHTEQIRAEQTEMQEQTRSEVNAQRQAWQEENQQIQQTYETQSQTQRQEIDRQIQQEVQTAETQADRELTEAETKAEAERVRAENEAVQKKREAENRPRSWWERVKGAISDAFQVIRDAINGIFDRLRKVVKRIIKAVKQLVHDLIEAVRDTIVALIEGYGEVLKGLVELALLAFPETAERVLQWIDETIDGAIEAVNDAAETLKTLTTQILDAIGQALDNALAFLQFKFNQVLDWLEDLVMGVIETLEAGITIHLPDLQLFPPVSLATELLRLSTGDIIIYPRAEAEAESAASFTPAPRSAPNLPSPGLGANGTDPEDAIELGVYVRGDLNLGLLGTIGPAWMRNITIVLRPFSSFYSGEGDLSMSTQATARLELAGVLGGKASFCAETARLEGGLQALGSAGIRGTFLAHPRLVYDNGELSFSAQPTLDVCALFGVQLNAIARAEISNLFHWYGSWELANQNLTKCWNIVNGISYSRGGDSGYQGGGEFGSGGGEFGGGGASGQFMLISDVGSGVSGMGVANSMIRTTDLRDSLGFSLQPQSPVEDLIDQLFGAAPAVDADTNAAACDTSPGSKMNPFELVWPKRPSFSYPVMYFGGRTPTRISQAEQYQKFLDGEPVGGVPVKPYTPHGGGNLPGGAAIGLSPTFHTFIGQVVGPLSLATTPGGKMLLRELRPYGFRALSERLDGDHVWEIQVGGQDQLPNLWPLNQSENRSGGARLATASVKYPNSLVYTSIPELKEQLRLNPALQYYFKLTGFSY